MVTKYETNAQKTWTTYRGGRVKGNRVCLDKKDPKKKKEFQGRKTAVVNRMEIGKRGGENFLPHAGTLAGYKEGVWG